MFPAHQSGTILKERYKLTNIVGKGGMGNVYRAEDLRLPGRLCAIKEVMPDPLAPVEIREQAQSQFLQEARILAKLDHPNLPKVSDFFAETGRDYLVMDYVPGDDLKQILTENGGAIEQEVVLAWAQQIMNALQYLHEQDPPILHRDVKPANIKLTPGGLIKLVDFGLVKILATDDARTLTVMQGRGTVLYTPLEQYGGDSVHTDVRADVYSFGATIFHLLTDYPPLDAKSRFLNPRAVPDPRKYNPDVSAQVAEAIIWAMQMHPDDRPQTMAELREAVFGEGRVNKTRVNQRQTEGWLDAIRANRIAAVIALGLLVIAIIMTLV